MVAPAIPLRFEAIHIEVARNATDDFNPFHDPLRWRNIKDNPFGGPIALGFQLECLVAEHMRRYREQRGEEATLLRENLPYSCYEFRFVNAVRAHQEISIRVRDSRLRSGDNPGLANRVSLYAGGELALTGYKRESRSPLYLAAPDAAVMAELHAASDRTFLGDTGFFLKRKFMNTSNAKNFLCGSLVPQSEYIDELAERVRFPEVFPCSLLSCALLERAWEEGHDFEAQPMVYQAHNICIDRLLAAEVCSNDTLHLLNRPVDASGGGVAYECFGVLGLDRLLFRARIELMPLLAS